MTTYRRVEDVPEDKRCCWPGCRRPYVDEWNDESEPTPFCLCVTHALIVADKVREQFPDWYEQTAIGRFGGQVKPITQADGWIYYIKLGDRIKIGHSCSLTRRLATYPPDMRLLAAHRGTRSDEQALHSQFTPYRLAGREWYGQFPPILRHIRQMRLEHGDPRVHLPRRRHPKHQVVTQRSRSGGRYARN